ncbi:enoyl-CoA hydratase/isomerase family protein [Agromyces bauzanensis]|uniref:Uncharacterized protein n=1 Tax=Agromyces bauzanensis TaxID=1308924 RepID=A0A917PEV7_9MICO|nr:enoyl-CoA hydratase/isomerase family protein [Agromyces bauzanensis]GGJ73643.1 hypothetical protein GCM10011372_09580 [Agromyces bauzanensis]
MTYAVLDARVNQLARELSSRGLAKGDRLLLLSGNSDAFDCSTADAGMLKPGADGTHGLPAGYAIPAGTILGTRSGRSSVADTPSRLGARPTAGTPRTSQTVRVSVQGPVATLDLNPDRLGDAVVEFDAVIPALGDLPQPVIAKVRGAAVGAGRNLALACDFVVADQTARFTQPASPGLPRHAPGTCSTKHGPQPCPKRWTARRHPGRRCLRARVPARPEHLPYP